MNAVILAGGLGTRLRSVVHEVPKCMAPVAGRPFLWYLLSGLEAHNARALNTEMRVDRVVLSVGYLREVIFSWIDTVREHFSFEITFAIEAEPLGTGGGLRLALSECVADEVLVLNGDTMFDVDLAAFYTRHSATPAAAVSIALRRMHDFERYGTVLTEPSGLITGFREKQPCREGLINGGVYIIRRSRLDMDALPARFSFESEVLEPHVSHGDLFGYESDAYFIDIGIPADYRRAQFDFLVRYDLGYRTLLLDRDGTINVLRPGDYVKSWEEFAFMPDFLASAAGLSWRFEHIFIVTNQRGIGRGLMSEADLHSIHTLMIEEIDRHGGRIDGIYHCSATDSSHPDRKPQIGLWHQIQHDFADVRPESTVMVGDSDGDAGFAANAGMDFVRV